MQSTLNRQTLGDLLRRTRQRMPNKLAIRCGAVDWTYAQFDDICNRLAGGFAGQGVEIGDRVAIIARNSHAFAAVRFALARLGAVLVPINFMLNQEDAHYILAHSGARMLCVDSEFTALGRAATVDSAVTQFVWLPAEDPSPVMLSIDASMLSLERGTDYLFFRAADGVDCAPTRAAI